MKNERQDWDTRASERIQNRLFLEHISHLSKSPFYRAKFKSSGIDFKQITSVQDLSLLPTTTKNELESHNSEFLAVPEEQIIEYVTTSGTLGKPVSYGLTMEDRNRLAQNEFRALSIAGIQSRDTVLITTTLDQRFMAGLAYYLGVTQIGANVVRGGVGNLSFQLDNILRFNPTVLIAVPSFAIKLGEFLREQNIAPSDVPVKKIICIGESIRNSKMEPNSLNLMISELWEAKLYSTYASTEMSTAFTECDHGRGGHVLPELILVEVLDEELNAVGEGELGEIVATPLSVKGMPLLRYHTGDMARMYTFPCECGRISPRIGPVEGRKNQMIKFKGTSLYPEQIINVLHSFRLESFIIRLSRSEHGTDQVAIHIPDHMTGEKSKRVKQVLRENLRVSPELILSPVSEIKKMSSNGNSRKLIGVIDSR